MIVHGNILVRTWDSAARPGQPARPAAASPIGPGFEGIHIWDIADPANPVSVRSCGWPRPATTQALPPGCGAHTATGVPDDARGNLYLYVGGSSGTCTGMDIVRISLSDPTDAKFLRRAARGPPCHDNNVIMG